MVKKRKRRLPNWVEVALVLAVWPSPRSEMYISIYRRYRRLQRKGEYGAAARMLRKEALSYSRAAAERGVWWAVRIFIVA